MASANVMIVCNHRKETMRPITIYIVILMITIQIILEIL